MSDLYVQPFSHPLHITPGVFYGTPVNILFLCFIGMAFFIAIAIKQHSLIGNITILSSTVNRSRFYRYYKTPSVIHPFLLCKQYFTGYNNTMIINQFRGP